MAHRAEGAALVGRHIAITRPPEQAAGLARLLEAEGARVTLLSSIAIAPLDDTSRLDAAIGRVTGDAADDAGYDWVVFTSVNGVGALDRRLRAMGREWRGLRRIQIAAIGPATAQALEAHGVTPALVPDEYVAEGILRALGDVSGARLLLLRADIARKTLAEELRRRGAEVDEVAAYRTVVAPPDAALLGTLLASDRPDAITFTSSSTVRGLMQSLNALGQQPRGALAGVALACIGPVTAATLREYGLEPALVASEYTMLGLTRALVAYFNGETPAPAGHGAGPAEGV